MMIQFSSMDESLHSGLEDQDSMVVGELASSFRQLERVGCITFQSILDLCC